MEKVDNTPAPCAYNVEKLSLDHAPAYHFGLKVNHDKVDDIPGTIHLFE
jgi:hypothetical protein